MQKKREERGYLEVVGVSTIILFVIMIIIPLAFFYMLSNSAAGADFGLSEITFSVIFGLLATSFLYWTRSLSYTNPYLGTIIGLLTLVALEYSLFLRYSGGFTAIFAAISAIVVLIYLGMNFIQGLKLKGQKDEDFDE